MVSLAGGALATDEIGLFFDGQAQSQCTQAGAFTTLSTYLILIDASCGVCAWECAVRSENASFLGCAFPGGTANAATPPEFYLACDPLPRASLIVLAQLSFLTSGAGPVRFYIERCSLGLEETPQYADCADATNLVTMTPRTIPGGMTAAGVNLPECTPQSVTWGQVKSVFQ